MNDSKTILKPNNAALNTDVNNFSMQQQNGAGKQIWKSWNINVNVLDKFFNTKAKRITGTNSKTYHELKSTIKTYLKTIEIKKSFYLQHKYADEVIKVIKTLADDRSMGYHNILVSFIKITKCW